MSCLISHRIQTLLIITFLVFSYAPQDSGKDSLLIVLDQTKDPDTRAQILLQISDKVRDSDIIHSLELLIDASAYAESEGLKGSIWDRKGRLYFAKREFVEAEGAFNQAKIFYEAAGMLSDAAGANNRVGVALLRQKNHQMALEVFLESAAYYESAGEWVNLAMCHNNMAGVFADMGDYVNAVRYYEQSLPVFQEYGIKQFEIITLTNLAGQYLRLNNLEKSYEYNKLAEALGEELNDQYALGIVYNNLGQFAFTEEDYETALYYYEKSLAAKQSLGTGSDLVPTYNNIGQVLSLMDRPREAISYLRFGLNLSIGEERWPLLSNLAKAYFLEGQADSALFFFDQTLAARDSLFSVERQKVIDELRTAYETERKEIEIAQLQAIQKQNLWIFAGVTGFFGASLLIALLFLKNNHKKRVIAEQKEKMEKQNVEQLLKEQKWMGINAMTAGRVKEREKISEELHDNIGSMLATLKLYLDSLAGNKRPKQFKSMHEKASLILDDTYNQVRDMAHSKRAGVLISEGLLPAIEVMAEHISMARELKIEVTGPGLEKRLDADLETAIFKSVQELLSNIVKHSGANFAEVNISQDDTLLKIIIQDNGNGFDTENITWGQGFTTIRQRMLELNGEFIINSSMKSGTTVLMKMPLG